MVFKDKKVGDFVNSHFVSPRIHALKGDGKELGKKYDVRVFPTVLFLDAEGGEIDRACGFDGNKDDFFKIIKDYAAGKNTLVKMLSEVKANPDNLEINYKVAKKYLSRYENEKATPYFYKVLKLDPGDKKGYKTEATCYTALHEARFNKNVKPLLSFIAGNTNKEFYSVSYYGLISYYMKEKNTAKVNEVFEEALKKMPEDIGLMVGYSRYIFREKLESKYGRALELAKKTVTLAPEKEKHNAYMDLGYFYQDIKKFKEAEEAFLKVLKIKPDYTGAIYQLGRNIVFSGENLKKGLSYFQEYLKHKPKDGDPEWADAHWRMGLIYEKLDDKKQAASEYKKALKLKPGHEEAQKALKKLAS